MRPQFSLDLWPSGEIQTIARLHIWRPDSLVRTSRIAFSKLLQDMVKSVTALTLLGRTVQN